MKIKCCKKLTQESKNSKSLYAAYLQCCQAINGDANNPMGFESVILRSTPERYPKCPADCAKYKCKQLACQVSPKPTFIWEWELPEIPWEDDSNRQESPPSYNI